MCTNLAASSIKTFVKVVPFRHYEGFAYFNLQFLPSVDGMEWPDAIKSRLSDLGAERFASSASGRTVNFYLASETDLEPVLREVADRLRRELALEKDEVIEFRIYDKEEKILLI